MSEAAPIAERLDALAERAAVDIRNPEIRALFRDLLAVVGEIDATRAAPAPGTGLTPEQLEQAVGGAAFLASLGNRLDKIAAAREADVEQVVRSVLAVARPSARPNGTGELS